MPFEEGQACSSEAVYESRADDMVAIGNSSEVVGILGVEVEGLLQEGNVDAPSTEEARRMVRTLVREHSGWRGREYLILEQQRSAPSKQSYGLGEALDFASEDHSATSLLYTGWWIET